MSDKYNWCLGPDCHKKNTQDRVRGVKGNKVLRTRKIAATHWNQNHFWGYFCSQNCLHDYLLTNLQQLIAITPRPEPLETPCEVTTRKVQSTRYDWQERESVPYTYIEKSVTILDNNNG